VITYHLSVLIILTILYFITSLPVIRHNSTFDMLVRQGKIYYKIV